MSSTNKEGRTPVYESSFKVAVAREYLTSNLGCGRLAAKYQLPGAHTVRYFVKWYKANYPDPALPLQAAATAVPPDSTNQEVAELRKQLQQANLKVAGWEMMLEIARKELGVDIVKKYGTKQSPK